MISKDLLKSINSLIPKKSFSPELTQFMYYKEFDTFLATDSYILLEIKNPFEPFANDFCIDGVDLKTIKTDIIAISHDKDDLVNIITKDKDYIFKVKKDLRQPPYKGVLDQFKQSPKETICNSQNYIKFFEIANNLKLDTIVFGETMIRSMDQDLLLMVRIQQKY